MPFLATVTLVHLIFVATLAVGIGTCVFYHLGRR